MNGHDRMNGRDPLVRALGAGRPLRIAQVAPPLEAVPPVAYGGTERVVHELTEELIRRGHEVTLFASGDSKTSAELVPTVERALRPAGFADDATPQFLSTLVQVLDRAAEFDVIHSHLEWHGLLLARVAPVPVVSTFHGRLDFPWAASLLEAAPGGHVAISRNQASVHPDIPFSVVHNGLRLERAPFERRRGDALCFVGRIDPEKGILDAIQIARESGRSLRIAAKIGPLPFQQAFFEDAVKPALKAAGSLVEFLGELRPAERDRLFAESAATIMPGAWPEPFGLVAIESMACGTPVIARRIGALPEIVRHGIDGWFGDDVEQLAYWAAKVDGFDRAAIRRSVIERFSASRMADGYEAVYRELIAGSRSAVLAEAGRPAAISTAAPSMAALNPSGGALTPPIAYVAASPHRNGAAPRPVAAGDG